MRTMRAVRRTLALGALAIAAACGGGEPAEEAAPEAAAEQPQLIPPMPQSRLAISPREGPPGTEVTLTMSGLMASQQDMEIGLGDLAGHEIIGHADSDAEGNVSTVIAIPAATPPGTRYFFISDVGGSPISVSDSFVVTAAP